ncbi:MAG: hypothetical protein JWL65_2643 [Gammaproteobacteria bacterium]|nr:hypothetical protein [Gammaproteobacteria bacterium]
MKSHMITGGGGIQLHVVETGKASGQSIMFIQYARSWTVGKASRGLRRFTAVGR